MDIKPSKYQQAILDWIRTGKGNAACNAVAGSGKSSTLKMVALQLESDGINPANIRVIVFGKENSKDLIEKFGSNWKDSISTLHSAGFNLLKRELDIRKIKDIKISSTKYKWIAQDEDLIGKRGTKGSLRTTGAIAKDSDFLKLVDLVRLTNNKPDATAVKDLCNHFEIPEIFNPGTVAKAIAFCLERGEQKAINRDIIDFTDQIWLPVKWELTKRNWFQPFEFVLIDECQDLNAAQLELAIGLAGDEGRMLFVGDPYQAIMGFAGADNRSYQKIVTRTNAVELPLSICYRCPRSHIELVRNNFQNIPIEPREDALLGTIQQIDNNKLHDYLKVGDRVISRKTAPLISCCIRLLAKGIAATVKGRDIGETIKRELEEIQKMPGFVYSSFNEFLQAYEAAKIKTYQSLDNEEQLIENLKDKLQAISIIYTSNPAASSIVDLEQQIDSLFSDEVSPVTLSTCHRAKGLEGDRIFIIKPEDMPMKWRNILPWQEEQENNLLYVALTRSKNELYIVGDPEWLKENEKKPTEKNLQSESELEDLTEEEINLEFEKAYEKHKETINTDLPPEVMASLAMMEDLVEQEEEKPYQGWTRQQVPLSRVELNAGTQSRIFKSQKTIDDYAQQMRDGLWNWEREPLPKFYYHDAKFYPGDGHHRSEAAIAAGETHILAEVKTGTTRDARFHSTGANKDHGLQRNTADKRNQVSMLLLDPEWAQMSDRAIAAHVGVSAPTVAAVKQSLAEQGILTVNDLRVDRAGRVLNTANIGTRKRLTSYDKAIKALDGCSFEELHKLQSFLQAKLRLVKTRD